MSTFVDQITDLSDFNLNVLRLCETFVVAENPREDRAKFKILTRFYQAYKFKTAKLTLSFS